MLINEEGKNCSKRNCTYHKTNHIETSDCNGIKIRNLREKDAEKMLEWMHDDSVARFFRKDFSKKLWMIVLSL